jgi:SAM-dependent methyltransferase
MISPEDIRWRGDDASPVGGTRCPVCGDTAPRQAILDVPSMAPPYPELTLLRCPACGSGHFEPPGIASFADLGQNREDFWRFYVEVGGGVWETLWPILAVDGAPSPATLLDVGCGFGFAVDGWSRLGRGEAIGVELADYGQVGARLLGITVCDQLLDDWAPLAGRQFDIVYASEVIEHVPDPGAFVATLARYVAADGVLVLTTPSMAFVTRAEHSSTLHAALAPGFHGFLLSAEAFADTARRSDFAHVDVRNFGERQILWASRVPLHIDTGAARMFPDYLRYLESRVATDDPSSPVWQGLAYRLVKEWSNGGQAQRALALADRLLAAIAVAFGAESADPQSVAARLRACADLTEVGKAMPYFLPNLYFHLGNLALTVERDGTRAQRMYAGTVACTLEVCRFGSIFFLEAISLVWPARAALADILFARQQFADGATMYAHIAAAGDLGHAEDAHARAGAQMLEVRVPAMAEHVRRQGAGAAARTIFDGYCAHVRRRYGDTWLTASGVDAALARGIDPAPLDPLFAPWFAAMLALTASGAGPAAAATVHAAAAVIAVAGCWSGDARWGTRMLELAQQLQAAMPLAAGERRVAWTMSTTYKL